MMQLRGYDIDYDDFCDVLYLMKHGEKSDRSVETCLLYTSDAADE